MDDLDSEPDTITIKTEMFSTDVIVFKQVPEAGMAGTNAGINYFVSHLQTAAVLWIACVPVLGILFFLNIILLLCEAASCRNAESSV